MKFLVALVVVAYVANGALAKGLDEEEVKKIIAMKNECIESTGIDKEVVKKMKDGEINDDKLSKEFILCFSKKGGFIDDNNKVNKDHMKAGLIKKHGEEVAEKVMTACGDKTGPTALDTAYLMAKCYQEHKE